MWRRVVILLVATSAAALAGSEVEAQEPGRVYGRFNEFCIAHFGAEKEPLAYEIFGKDLRFLEDGKWLHVSESSAAVGFETALPAKTHVEYGPTAAYGRRTAETERHFTIHLHTLGDLKRETQYHYRLVATDERGGKITSPDMTFTTKQLPDAVHIPDDLEGPPYVLDGEGATYLLTRDLRVPGQAFEVKAKNVTLDLGGHVVTYNDKSWGPIKSGNFHDWIRGAKYGIRALRAQGFKVFNGTVRQGAGADAAQGASIGYNPMYISGGDGMEVAGVTVDYSGPQQIGIYNHWGGNNSEFHHNVFVDRGTKVINRHGAGSRALVFYGMRETKGIRVHHNLVKRTRQSGLSGDEVYHNEVYVESWAPNAFGLAGKRIYGNRVFGTGHHVCAIGWGGVREVYNNYVHLEAEEPVARYTRARASMNGMRFTLYGEGTQECAAVVYHDNIVVVAARDGGQARGLQFSTGTKAAGRIFRNNTVKALARDHTSDQTCVVAEGNPKLADQHLPMVYANTTFIGTTVHLRLGGGNPPGSNHQFHNCRFVKVGDDPRYTTLLFPSGYASKNHVFRDCTFEGGASLDSVRWANDRADHGFTVQWTLTVRTAPDARVTITDKAGKEVFSGSADGVGVAAVPLSQYVARPADKTFYTPHQVKVEKDGKTVTKTVTMDAKQEVEIGL